MNRIDGERVEFRRKGMWVAVVALAICVLSLFVIRPVLASPDTYASQFRSLDAKRDTVLTLVASSSAASAVITLIPDDVGTPIAEQLASLSTTFTLILAVLMAEKYLMTILGGFSTALLIPALCAMWVIYYYFYDAQWLKNMAIKFAVLALALLTLIPASVFVSDQIEATFRTSIDETINTALESENMLNIQSGDEKNLWEKITGAANDAVNSIGNAVDIAKHVLGNFVNAIAVLLVTSCVIPILVLLVYMLLIKYVFGLNFNAERTARLALAYRQLRLPKKPK